MPCPCSAYSKVSQFSKRVNSHCVLVIQCILGYPCLKKDDVSSKRLFGYHCLKKKYSFMAFQDRFNHLDNKQVRPDPTPLNRNGI